MSCRINQFCFCASVRVAAIVAAIINMLSVLISIANGVILLTGVEPYKGKKEYEEAVRFVTIFAGLYFTEAAIGLIVLVFLILALNKGSAPLLIPWLVAYMVLIALTICSTIWNMTNGFAVNLLFALLLHFFMIYVWIAVYSYYQDLRDGTASTSRDVPCKVT